MQAARGTKRRQRARITLLLLVITTPLLGAEADSRPNIVLLTLESLRTDHVGFYPGGRPTTPVLDALARESVVYDDAHAVTSWTLASHASLFTGLYPTAHQTVGPTDRLDVSYHTLAEVLTAAGYQTVGIASGPYLRRAHQLDQGFAHYDDSIASVSHSHAHGDVTNPAMASAVRRFLTQERDPKRPFFLFGYFWDPHYVYRPPAPWNRTFRTDGDTEIDLTDYEDGDAYTAASPPSVTAYVHSQYDGEIAWTDHTLGPIFQLIRDQGLWENTAILVTSDHGEEFFEHGHKGHKQHVFAESVHVPLVVKYPGGERRGRDDRLVSLVDLFPTVLDLAGAQAPAKHSGRSLLAKPPPRSRPIFFELLYVWFDPDPEAEPRVVQKQWYGIRRGDYKLVSVSGRRAPYLFDVARDPGEQHDLAASTAHARMRQSLAQGLLRWHARAVALREGYRAGGEAVLAPEELERLRALGYLEE